MSKRAPRKPKYCVWVEGSDPSKKQCFRKKEKADKRATWTRTYLDSLGLSLKVNSVTE